ncbi:MAG: MBL fold metallo-hydrolase [Lentisphaerae bacterium]|nr:MBL fold metallo-hydrolase [Lentisphaerota bacterium]
MIKMTFEELLPGFWKFTDTCNVYVLQDGNKAIAIDFGSGKWLAELPLLGITGLEHVLLTHHHDDQCDGLLKRGDWSFEIHAPAGEELFLSPDKNDSFHRAPWFGDGCPLSYAAPHGRIGNIKYDLAGFESFLWNNLRLRVIHTPGHGSNACSIVIPHRDKQIVCCGDAAYEGAKIWEPYHLEWDHWTGSGALAAWEGVERLSGIGIDMLCPSHGPVISSRPRNMLRILSERLLQFYRQKGQISPGEPDRNMRGEKLDCGAWRYLPNLYQYGQNGYLLTSREKEALVVDPTMKDMKELESLLKELKVIPSAIVVSHYHFDHCDAIPELRSRYGAKAWLHPQVAEPWKDPEHTILPWLLQKHLDPFELWPEQGVWNWNEYSFKVAPWPGQTWWHCVFMTEVDGRKVMFAGDSFQPSSIWNGTGGFCAYNNSRFLDGYMTSAQLALDWSPDITAAGHTNCCLFSPQKFVKIQRWARKTHDAVLALCPSGDLEKDYYSLFDRISEKGFHRLPASPHVELG